MAKFSSQHYITRPMQESDLRDVCDIFNHAILTSTAIFRTDPVSLLDRKTWFADIVERHRPCYVAILFDDTEKKEFVVGYGYVDTFRPHPCYEQYICY